MGSNPTNGCCVPTPSQRVIPPGSVNEYQRKLGSKRADHAMHNFFWSRSFGWCPAEVYRKQRSALPYGPMRLGKGLYFLHAIYVKMAVKWQLIYLSDVNGAVQVSRLRQVQVHWLFTWLTWMIITLSSPTTTVLLSTRISHLDEQWSRWVLPTGTRCPTVHPSSCSCLAPERVRVTLTRHATSSLSDTFRVIHYTHNIAHSSVVE